MAYKNITESDLKLLKGTWDFAVQGGAEGEYVLGRFPSACLVMVSASTVITTVTSGGAATISIGVTSDPSAMRGAEAYTTFTANTIQETAAMFVVEAGDELLFTIADADLTAGKVKVFLQYVDR